MLICCRDVVRLNILSVHIMILLSCYDHMLLYNIAIINFHNPALLLDCTPASILLQCYKAVLLQ